MKKFRRFAITAIALSLFAAGPAQAQWVFLGTKAIGAIRQMTSSPKDGQAAGYDSASVLLDASAEGVYRKAVEIIGTSPTYHLTKQDDQALTLEFTDGKMIAGLQVNSFDKQLSQLLIVSNAPAENAGSSLVVNGVLRICKEVEIHCEAAPTNSP